MDVDKLKMIKEAEAKAQKVIEFYRHMAEEAVSNAQEEGKKMREEEEARARERAELESEQIIKLAMAEVEEIRLEYVYDRLSLYEAVVKKRERAVAFLLNRLLDE